MKQKDVEPPKISRAFFLDSYIEPASQQFTQIELDFILEKTGSIINFLQGQRLVSEDIAVIKHSFPMTNSTIILGGTQTLFTWQVTLESNVLIPEVVIKPYITGTVESLIQHTASVHYWYKFRHKLITIQDKQVFIHPMVILGIAIYQFTLGRSKKNFPILIQAYNPELKRVTTESYISIDQLTLNIILKYLADKRFSVDSHPSNWQIVSTSDNSVLAIDYIDLMYCKDHMKLQDDINNILTKFE